MHQTEKVKQWYFWMKVHIRVDAARGLIHSVQTTSANMHVLTSAPELLYG
jgi:IS5 family transposase